MIYKTDPQFADSKPPMTARIIPHAVRVVHECVIRSELLGSTIHTVAKELWGMMPMSCLSSRY